MSVVGHLMPVHMDTISMDNYSLRSKMFFDECDISECELGETVVIRDPSGTLVMKILNWLQKKLCEMIYKVGRQSQGQLD